MLVDQSICMYVCVYVCMYVTGWVPCDICAFHELDSGAENYHNFCKMPHPL